jgi:regulator of nonsense transcripts 2
MQEYIRKLIYKDLSKTTTEKVLRQLRKLTWDNEEVNWRNYCRLFLGYITS